MPGPGGRGAGPGRATGATGHPVGKQLLCGQSTGQLIRAQQCPVPSLPGPCPAVNHLTQSCPRANPKPGAGKTAGIKDKIEPPGFQLALESKTEALSLGMAVPPCVWYYQVGRDPGTDAAHTASPLLTLGHQQLNTHCQSPVLTPSWGYTKNHCFAHVKG